MSVRPDHFLKVYTKVNGTRAASVPNKTRSASLPNRPKSPRSIPCPTDYRSWWRCPRSFWWTYGKRPNTEHRDLRRDPRMGTRICLRAALTCPNGYTFTTVQNRREKGHGKLYDYYRCGYCNLPTNRHLEKCGITNIRRTDVDAAVWAWVQQLVTADGFAEALDERQANSSGARAEIAERIAVCERTAADAQAEITRYASMTGPGKPFTEADVVPLVAQQRALRDSAQTEIDRLTLKLADVGLSPRARAVLEAQAREVARQIADAEVVGIGGIAA